MNWVGGIRRRILQKEEEKRRQEQYFAAHAANTRQNVGGVGGSTLKRRGCISRPKARKSEEFIYKRISNGSQRNTSASIKENDQEYENNKNLDVIKGNKYVRDIYPTSLHGPFSRFLLQLEMNGIKERQRKNRQLKKMMTPYEKWREAQKKEAMKRNYEKNKAYHMTLGCRDTGTRYVNTSRISEKPITKKSRNESTSCDASFSQYHRVKSANLKESEKSSTHKNRSRKVESNKDNKLVMKQERQTSARSNNADNNDNTRKELSASVHIVKNKQMPNRSKVGYTKSEGRSKNKSHNDSKQKDPVPSTSTGGYTKPGTISRVTDKCFNSSEFMKSESNKENLRPVSSSCEEIKNCRDYNTEQELLNSRRKNKSIEMAREDVNGKEYRKISSKNYNQVIKSSSRIKNREISKASDSGYKNETISNVKKKSNTTNSIKPICELGMESNSSENNYSKCFHKSSSARNTYKEPLTKKIKFCHVPVTNCSGWAPFPSKSSGNESIVIDYSPITSTSSFEDNSYLKYGAKSKIIDKFNSPHKIGNPSLLAGAPRLRRLLTLSPERHKGPIWEPMNISKASRPVKKECDVKERVERVDVGKKTEKLSTMKKRKKIVEFDDWESNRIKELIGTLPRPVRSPNKEIFEINDKHIISSLTDESKIRTHQNNIEKIILTQKENNTKPFQKEVPVSISRQEPNLKEGYASENIPNPIETITLNETPIIPKLNYKRKLTYIKTDAAIDPGRKDMTPYQDTWISMTPGIKIMTTPSSGTLSKTPTDPTLELMQESFNSVGEDENILGDIRNNEVLDENKTTIDDTKNVNNEDNNKKVQQQSAEDKNSNIYDNISKEIKQKYQAPDKPLDVLRKMSLGSLSISSDTVYKKYFKRNITDQLKAKEEIRHIDIRSLLEKNTSLNANTQNQTQSGRIDGESVFNKYNHNSANLNLIRHENIQDRILDEVYHKDKEDSVAEIYPIKGEKSLKYTDETHNNTVKSISQTDQIKKENTPSSPIDHPQFSSLGRLHKLLSEENDFPSSQVKLSPKQMAAVYKEVMELPDEDPYVSSDTWSSQSQSQNSLSQVLITYNQLSPNVGGTPHLVPVAVSGTSPMLRQAHIDQLLDLYGQERERTIAHIHQRELNGSQLQECMFGTERIL